MECSLVFVPPQYFLSANDEKSQYDFHNPSDSLNEMWNCLKPGGYLGIMTKLVIDKAAFANWHYKNDPTHVCFFSTKTFNWLINHWQAKVVFRENDVIILQKNG